MVSKATTAGVIRQIKAQIRAAVLAETVVLRACNSPLVRTKSCSNGLKVLSMLTLAPNVATVEHCILATVPDVLHRMGTTLLPALLSSEQDDSLAQCRAAHTQGRMPG
jgi:hypothetical protein